MPKTTILHIPPAEQAQICRPAPHALWLPPGVTRVTAVCNRPHATEIATVLFCSRSSVYRIVRLYHTGQLGFTIDGEGEFAAPVRTTVDALDQTIAGRPAQGPTSDVWVVSHPLELCGAGARTPRQHGLDIGVDGAALAP